MLVTSETNSGPSSRTQSLLDSPTLARVERARLRLEAAAANNGSGGGGGGGSSSNGGTIINGGGKREDSLERSILDPKYSFLAGKIPIESISGPIKRGLLWQQRDRLFSRWKERYFILTRDYLHCFKRASGTATERISDMGQFIFKVKLVDVEKVEWLNRRSYSAIGLLLGREGRVLLRCENGLEDWFELLEECTLSSKERRQQLRSIQGPRSRASLAAPPSHASVHANHMALGSTYSSAVEDWLLSRQKISNSINHFPLSDSVPDLTGFNENSGITTHHSTPQRIPYHLNNNSRYSINSNGYGSECYGTPLRQHFQNQMNNKNFIIVDEDDGTEVQLRHSRDIGNGSIGGGSELNCIGGIGGGGTGGNRNGRSNGRCDNGNLTNNDKDDFMYRKPSGPNDIRHSCKSNISGGDSGLDTPPSTSHRPSSCRDVYYMKARGRDSMDTGVSSSRGTTIRSPQGSFRQNGNTNNLRYLIQENILRQRNEEEIRNSSIRSSSKLNHNVDQQQHHPQQQQQQQQPQQQQQQQQTDIYSDSNQNNYYHKATMNGNSNGHIIHHNNHITQHHHQQQQQQQQQQHQQTNGNHLNNSVNQMRDRYQQHPVLAAIINESQGMKFRDRSYSDIQQHQQHQQQQQRIRNMALHNNNSHSPSPRRRPICGTPTRV